MQNPVKRVMNLNNDYQLHEKIHETNLYIAYQAKRRNDGQACIVKVLKARYPSPSAIALFQRVSSLINARKFNGIVGFHELIEVEGKIAVVMEAWEGCPLKELFGRRMDLRTFLDMAMSLAETLGNLHQNNIFFRDINPDNIFVNHDTGEVKLANFGLESILIHEQQAVIAPYAGMVDLVFLSPEQTGRMNVSIDHRSDLYSLGMVFYTLLSGSLPLAASEPMEIIHAHLAKDMVPLSLELPHIPEVLSRIVMKLLAKNPDERYQSAYALLGDLRKCRHGLEKYGNIESFEIGCNDIPIRFFIPKMVVGREKEKNDLLSIYEKVRRGANETVLITGPSGIGKTTFVREAAEDIVGRKGYFIAGKCDPFQDSPYSSTVQAFTELFRRILTEGEQNVAVWKEKLLHAVGRHGKLLTDVIPELAHIIGKQPDIGDLNAKERFTLFDLISKNLIKVFATREHPLTLFLDDLQWVDRATLTLTAVQDQSIRHFCFIGAFRDNEVDESHHLNFMTNLVMRQKKIHFIHLASLGEEDTHQIVRGVLKGTSDEARPLSQLVCKKTGGNPFFINQCMKNLYESRLLVLDTDAGWHWDLEEIREVQVTDNVLTLLESKIELLPEQVKDTLKVCACVGGGFNLNHLAMVANLPVDRIVEDLLLASDAGFVAMQGETVWFQHDQIQETLYASVTETERNAIHYRIGRTLLDIADDGYRQENLFYITDQLNKGVSFLKGENEKIELAYLNFECARKAKASSAYRIAYEYSEKAREMLHEKAWETHYELTLAIFETFIEVAYLEGNFNKMEELGRLAMAHARSSRDEMRIYEAQIKACIAQQDLARAVKIGIALLALQDYPQAVGKWGIAKELFKLKAMLGGRTIDSLEDLPEAKDPLLIDIMRIGAKMGHALYSMNPEMFAAYVLLNIQGVLKHGMTREIPQTLVAYGIILMKSTGEMEKSYEFGKLALRLVERPGSREYRSMVIFMINTLMRHWHEHIRLTVDELSKGYHAGIESGDPLYAALNLSMRSIMAYHAGCELPALERQMQENFETIDALNHEEALDQQRMHYQAVLNLLGQSPHQTRLSGEAFDEDAALARWDEINHRPILASYYAIRFVLDTLFHNYDQALLSVQEAKRLAVTVSGSVIDRDVPYYGSLILLALYPGATIVQKAGSLISIKRNIKKLKKMVHYAPMNNLHRLHLVMAEYARVRGNRDRAEDSYDIAIFYAGQNRYIQEEGFANELAARYFISVGREKTAAQYLNSAYACYEKWGAAAKLRDLEKNYGPYLCSARKHSWLPVAGDRRQNAPQAIDLSMVICASQSIAGEIDYSRLLEKTLKLVMENVAARKGMIILKFRDRLLVEAERTAEDKAIRVRQSIPIDEHEGLCFSVVEYVAMAHEVVCLRNASIDGTLSRDPYIVKNTAKSILCGPILNKGVLAGVLYLENNLSEGVFTQQSIDLLNLFSSQVAISMDNIKFYEQMEAVVNERKKDLQEAARELNLEMNRRRNTEEELRVSHYRLAKILDSATDTIIVFNQLREVVFFNKGAEALFRLMADEILWQPVFGLLPEDSTALLEQEIAALENSSPEARRWRQFTMNVRRTDGLRFPAHIGLSAFSIEGEPFYSAILIPADDLPAETPGGIGAAMPKTDLSPGDFVQRFSALEKAIKDISLQLNSRYFEDSHLREMVAKLMVMTLFVWEKVTKKTKVDLAEESGLWTAYCDHGTWRTRTLDKYLSVDTLPKKPRYHDVIKTADYALTQFPERSEDVLKLEDLLIQVKEIFVKWDSGN